MTVTKLEAVHHVAPLGVRFWDVAARTALRTGLDVSVRPAGSGQRVTVATVGRSGVHSFHNLPGLGLLETGEGTPQWWAANREVRDFSLEAKPRSGDLLAAGLNLKLPLRGLARNPAAALFATMTPDASWLPVFSSSTRPVEGAQGALRANILDAATGRPAAWALCEARTVTGLPSYGVADELGRLCVWIPYPEPPNAGPRIPLSKQSWPLVIRFFFGAVATVNGVADLASVLRQPPAAAWLDAARTQPLTTAVLSFGRDLILRTADAPTLSTLSILRNP